MAAEHRSSAASLTEELIADPRRFAFFRAVQILLKAQGVVLKDEALSADEEMRVIFRVAPALGFATADIDGARRIPDPEGGRDYYEVTTNFLGLHGASSPLPGYFLEAAAFSKGEEGVQQAFQDFFSHRLIWLLFLIWRKYRHYVRYQPGATDKFSNWMFALAGVGAPELRRAPEENQGGGQKADLPWPKLLSYIGLISARANSPRMVAGVIAHAFSLEEAAIEELALRRVEIPQDQRMRLGRANTTLNGDALIGTRVRDRMGKFNVVLKNLEFRRFLDFLPNGSDHRRLKRLVEFLLKDQSAYDLVLHTRPEQAPNFILSDPERGRLGWTSFIGQGQQATEKRVVIQARV